MPGPGTWLDFWKLLAAIGLCVRMARTNGECDATKPSSAGDDYGAFVRIFFAAAFAASATSASGAFPRPS